MSLKKDLSNQVFGRLTALSVHSTTRNGHIRWKCKCSCGVEKNVLSTHLLSKKTLSCGCVSREGGERRPDWKGYGDISGNCWWSIKRCRKERVGGREIGFSITIQHAWELFVAQEGKCALSGITLVFEHEDGVRVREVRTASLDRIDSSKGYIEGNVQWVHKDVNIMKNKLTDNTFTEWCKTIADYQRQKEKQNGVEEPSKAA